MSLQINKALWLPWGELWNGNLSIADEIIAPNFVAHFAPIGNSPAEVHGPDGLKQWIGGWLAAFSDYRFTTAVGPLAEDDLVAGRWIFRATYQGGMPGASPAAIGKQIEYVGMDLFRVEGRKIVEYWLCGDTLQLLQQVGIIPS
jgi:predicted ester cyclase